MKKVKNRALSTLILVLAVVLGLGVYAVKYAAGGSKWAAAANVYNKGAQGTLTDRNGVVLADTSGGVLSYADNQEVRRATLHAVGDISGNIGTGALSVYASKLAGYNIITGTYSRTDEGDTVALSIDSTLSTTALKALGGQKGAVMVMNYKTGEVLCAVSSPTYDPNDPPSDIEDNPDYEGVYLNRAISSAYTPGSTFKLITAAAAIEQIPDISERVFNCGGSLETEKGTVNCTKAHGELSFEDALAVSCNTVFGELSLELGADTLEAYAKKYGLTERISVGSILSASGNFDKAEPDTADLAWSGIGQYNNTVCPAAMLRFVGAIANGGEAVSIELLRRSAIATLTPARTSRIMNAVTAEKLGAMMGHNVSHTYGTESFPGLEMYAKSGTAEVGGDNKPHSWFVGYIVNEGYPLAFAVIVENGGGGTAVAGAVANKVLQAAVSGG